MAAEAEKLNGSLTAKAYFLFSSFSLKIKFLFRIIYRDEAIHKEIPVLFSFLVGP